MRRRSALILCASLLQACGAGRVSSQTSDAGAGADAAAWNADAEPLDGVSGGPVDARVPPEIDAGTEDGGGSTDVGPPPCRPGEIVHLGPGPIDLDAHASLSADGRGPGARRRSAPRPVAPRDHAARGGARPAPGEAPRAGPRPRRAAPRGGALGRRSLDGVRGLDLDALAPHPEARALTLRPPPGAAPLDLAELRAARRLEAAAIDAEHVAWSGLAIPALRALAT